MRIRHRFHSCSPSEPGQRDALRRPVSHAPTGSRIMPLPVCACGIPFTLAANLAKACAVDRHAVPTCHDASQWPRKVCPKDFEFSARLSSLPSLRMTWHRHCISLFQERACSKKESGSLAAQSFCATVSLCQEGSMQKNLPSLFSGPGRDMYLYTARRFPGQWRTQRDIPIVPRLSYRGSRRLAANRGGRRRTDRKRRVSRVRLARKVAARRARSCARARGKNGGGRPGDPHGPRLGWQLRRVSSP